MSSGTDAEIVVTLAGRAPLRPATSTTFDQDGYMVAEARAAGLDRINPADPADVVARVMASPRRPHLLAGALVEDGKPWSRAWAAQVAEQIAGCTDAATKAVLTEITAQVIVGFFVAAGQWSPTSPTASTGAAASAISSAATLTADPATAAPATSASGALSSAISPAMTPAGSTP